MTATQTLLKTQFPDWNWHWEYQLAPQTYFKIGGPAEAYIELKTVSDLQGLLAFCAQNKIPWRALGGASNVLVADEGIRGVVLHLVNDDIQVEQTISDKVKVTAGAGCKMPLLVKHTVDAGLTGLEFFLGVPGTLGGATYNNAHYLSHLIGQYIERVQVVSTTGELQWLTQAECAFGYDSSRFQTSHELIVTVEFRLAIGDRDQSQAAIKEATLYRAQTQPLGEPSSGCIFQNVPNTPELRERFPQFADRSHVPGGFLIDQAGLKGSHVGPIEVSQVHAAFFVNKGGGTAAQVKQLIGQVKQKVKEAFQVELHEEVFYLV